jgi:hypothetical protein
MHGVAGEPGMVRDKNPNSDSEAVSPTVTSTNRLTCDSPGGLSESERQGVGIRSELESAVTRSY